jgi:hypothetical protein
VFPEIVFQEIWCQFCRRLDLPVCTSSKPVECGTADKAEPPSQTGLIRLNYRLLWGYVKLRGCIWGATTLATRGLVRTLFCRRGGFPFVMPFWEGVPMLGGSHRLTHSSKISDSSCRMRNMFTQTFRTSGHLLLY